MIGLGRIVSTTNCKIVFAITLLLAVNAFGSEFKDKCYKTAGLKYLGTYENLLTRKAKLNANAKYVSLTYAKISSNLKKVQSEIEYFVKTKTNDDRNHLTPIYSNGITSYYILPSKYIIKNAAVACQQAGYQLAIPHRTGEFIALMNKLKKDHETPKMAFLCDIRGDFFYNIEGEFIGKYAAVGSTTAAKALDAKSYMTFPSLVSMNSEKTDFVVEKVLKNKAEDENQSVHIVCEGPTAINARTSHQKDIIESVVLPLKKMIIENVVIFEEKKAIHDDGTASTSNMQNQVKLIPGFKMNRLLGLSFKLSHRTYWTSSEINFDTIKELKDLIKYFSEKQVDSPKVFLQLGRIDELKATLSLPSKAFLSDEFVMEVLEMTNQSDDHAISAKFEYRYSLPSDVINEYMILALNTNGKVIQNSYFIEKGNDITTLDNRLEDTVECQDDRCPFENLPNNPIFQKCASQIINSKPYEIDSCKTIESDVPRGFRIKCRALENAIISTPISTNLQVRCGNSYFQEIYVKKNQILSVNTSCPVHYGSLLVLKASEEGEPSAPDIKNEEGLDLVTILASSTGSFAAVLIFVPLITYLLKKRPFNFSCCSECCKRGELTHAASIIAMEELERLSKRRYKSDECGESGERENLFSHSHDCATCSRRGKPKIPKTQNKE